MYKYKYYKKKKNIITKKPGTLCSFKSKTVQYILNGVITIEKKTLIQGKTTKNLQHLVLLGANHSHW